MKFKVFKVTPDKKQTLEYQLEIKEEEVRPGTSAADVALDYVLKNVPHQTSLAGLSPVPAADGVHLTKYVVLDDTDIWWMVPVWRFIKKPEPIVVIPG
jgi:hypothetical protein